VSARNSKEIKQQAELEEAYHIYKFGRPAEAEAICRRILRGRPSHHGANWVLGLILKGQDKRAEAEAAFRRVIAVAPEHVEAYYNLGIVLGAEGKLDDAERVLREAVKRGPDTADPLLGLAGVLFDKGRFADSIPFYRRGAQLAYGKGVDNAGGPIAPHKAQHDREQRNYLNNGAAHGATAVFNLEEGARVANGAVNPDSSGGEIEARWRNGSPQIVVIDNLLSDEALDRLRQFCWRSTIWQKVYPDGYLGAMPEHGFACPLLDQIAEELRSRYPKVIGEHPLTLCWAFKYDSQLKGINLHADFAAVNVNFWITPDEANLDAESGGLVVWDQPAPLDWDFDKFNNPGEAVRNSLIENGAKAVTVPHRANRAVIFDSDLFHETDRMTFKEGYLNRRINITMLFGYRENSNGASAATPDLLQNKTAAL
jgi:hypothetical protein